MQKYFKKKNWPAKTCQCEGFCFLCTLKITFKYMSGSSSFSIWDKEYNSKLSKTQRVGISHCLFSLKYSDFNVSQYNAQIYLQIHLHLITQKENLHMKHGDVALSIDYCFAILFRDKCDYRKTWICDVSAGDERVICNQEHTVGSDIYQITCKHKKTFCAQTLEMNTLCVKNEVFFTFVLRQIHKLKIFLKRPLMQQFD